MRAITIGVDAAGEAAPRVSERPEPRPGGREVQVAVRAAGMNRADLRLKTGHFQALGPQAQSDVAGMEAAGEVVACGADVTRFRVGDRVMGMVAGGHAERVCVDERLLMPMPAALGYEQAAGLPAALMTAHDALVTHGRFEPGQSVLVQAASSAIGIATAQLARALGAGAIVGTSTSPDKRERLLSLGLTHAVEGGYELEAAVEKATGGRGVDVVVDHIGAPALAENMACCRIGGRIVSVGRMGGTRGEIDLDLLSLKRLALVGVTFRTRTADDFARLIDRMQRDVGELLATRRIAMPIDKVFSFDQVAEAHAWMRSRRQFGKVILTP